MSKIEIKKIELLDEAEAVWKKISPNESIYDDWDFRYCFYKYFNHPLRFYAGYDGEELAGLLALQYNSESKRLEFFGGSFMEDNHVFIKKRSANRSGWPANRSGWHEEYIPKFYENINEPSRLEDICDASSFESSFDVFEYKYAADLNGLRNVDEYLAKYFKAKGRNAIKKKARSIEMLKPVIIENNYEDLDLFIELNKKRFGKESSFYKPFRHEIYHDLLNINLDIKMLTFIINGTKEAVTFGIKYKNTFVGINSGTREEAHRDLGTYITVKKIEKAIELGADKYDAGIEDLGWKENWHFEKIPQRIFIK